ncbi:hypothetical protein C7S13_3472 [Burkholderia cepacia]|nr:hypothetical protein [Burkholderia cepacia]
MRARHAFGRPEEFVEAARVEQPVDALPRRCFVPARRVRDERGASWV